MMPNVQIADLKAEVRPPAAVPVPAPSSSYARCLVFVLLLYAMVFGSILVKTDFLPYVMDNNESFSSLRHADNLARFGFRKSRGLTDESYAVREEGHPFVHTHQGNWPRIFSLLIYLIGAKTIESQITVTLLTVGLVAIFFAFEYFARIVSPVFGAIVCSVLITDYVLFTQWHLVTYRVWHCLFFFSALLCVHGLGGPRKRLWAILTILNYACLFYYELVFATFVAIFAALYTLVLHRRSPRLVLRAWVLQGLGGALSLGVLSAQLVAYLGWDGFLKDVRFTILARNEAHVASGALRDQMVTFFSQHNIVFWHNFGEGTKLRGVRRLLLSLTHFDLQTHTPYFSILAAILFAPWLFGNIGSMLEWVAGAGNWTRRLKRFAQRAVELARASLEISISAGTRPPEIFTQAFRVSLLWIELAVFRGSGPAGAGRGIHLSVLFVELKLRAWATRDENSRALRDTGVEVSAAIGPPAEPGSRRGVRLALPGLSASLSTGLSADASSATRWWSVATLESAVFVLALVLMPFDPGTAVAETVPLWRFLWTPLILALAAAALVPRFLNWFTSGRWAKGADIAAARLFTAALAVTATILILRSTADWFDPQFQPLWAEQLRGWLTPRMNRAALAAALFWVCALIARSPSGFLGAGGQLPRRLFAYFACGLGAYAIVYHLSPGYMMTGYLDRGLSLTVYFTALAVAIPIYQFGHAVWMASRKLGYGRLLTPDAAKLGLSLALLAIVVGLWLHVQARWVALLPPNHYAFLKKLKQPPYRGASFAVGNYGAPVAAFTGTWAYFDAGLAAGEVILHDDAFYMERDLRYLWFADRKTNPVYRKPDYYACMAPQSLATVLVAIRERGGQRQYLSCLDEELIRQDWQHLPRALDHRLIDWDREGERSHLASWAIVKLDWEYPPFLKPAPGADPSYPVAIAVIEKERSSGGAGYEVTYDHRYAQQDGTPASTPVVELLSYGTDADCASSDNEFAVLARSEGSGFELPADFQGKVAVRVTPRSMYKTGLSFYSRIIRVDPGSRFHLQPCASSLRLQSPQSLKAVRPEPATVRLTWDRLPDAKWYRIETAAHQGGFDFLGVTSSQFPTYQLVGAAATDSHYFRVCGCASENECSDYAHVESRRVPPLDGKTPKRLQVTRLKPTVIRLSWREMKGVDHYQVEMARGSGHFTLAGKGAGHSHLYTIADVSPVDEYRFRVRACTPQQECSEASNVALSETPVAFSGRAPSELRAQRITSSEIRLSWKGVPGADHYQFAVAKNSEKVFHNPGVHANDTAFTLKGVESSTDYRLRVRACTEDGACSAFSEEVTSLGRKPFPSPAGLRARRVSAGAIRLAWNAVAGADHYRIEAARDSDEYAHVASVDGDETTHTLKGLVPYGEYRFRLSACTAEGACSGSSREVEADNARPFGDRAPSGFRAERLKPGVVRLFWDKMPRADHYRIEMLSADRVYHQIAMVAGDRGAYTVKPVEEDRGYRFRLRACSEAEVACSKYSSVVGGPAAEHDALTAGP